MFTSLENIVAIDVAAEPIIWFIASCTALISISDSSWFSTIPSPPIIKLAITAASSVLIISIFLPIIPLVYSTSNTTVGVSKVSFISFNVVIETTGVVIFTFWFIIW